MREALPVISPGREAWYRSRGIEPNATFVGSTRFPDSISKLLFHIACLTPDQEVTYKGRPVVPTPPTKVTIGPSVFRQFTCATGCTSCCLPFTLDYTPHEFKDLPEEMQDRVPWVVREIVVSGKRRPVITFNQAVFPTCPFLTAQLPHGEGLGCALWPRSPIECASAPQLTLRWQKPGWGSITKRPFGRGWMFVPPAQCAFDEVSEASTRIILQKDATLIERYAHWADYLGIDTLLPQAATLFRSFKDRAVPVPSPTGSASIRLYP